MSIAFEPFTINGLEIKNRFVRSATWEGMAAEDGSVSERLINTLVELARGEVGLIIPGHAYVQPRGKASSWQLGIYRDELLPGLKRLTAAIHESGGKTVAQLAHAGVFTTPELAGGRPFCVSEVDGLPNHPHQEISPSEIQGLVSDFAAAAGRAKEAGFDGVQIHSAHGYFLSQFLSPAFNKRTDDYGGSLKNRVRIHLDVLRAVRREVGRDYPVLVKLNCEDFVDGGLLSQESVEAAKLMAGVGLDAIELSGGILTGGKLAPSRPGINSRDKEAYFSSQAGSFRAGIELPLILVGGMRSPEKIEEVISGGTADFVSLSRPLIREPQLVKRWREGDRRPAECVSDNLCFTPAMEGKGIYCLSREREQT
ncbi:MAG: NADH:flavin oxidoreductase [Desulfonatronovibrionaceae bacterium]